MQCSKRSFMQCDKFVCPSQTLNSRCDKLLRSDLPHRVEMLPKIPVVPPCDLPSFTCPNTSQSPSSDSTSPSRNGIPSRSPISVHPIRTAATVSAQPISFSRRASSHSETPNHTSSTCSLAQTEFRQKRSRFDVGPPSTNSLPSTASVHYTTAPSSPMSSRREREICHPASNHDQPSMFGISQGVQERRQEQDRNKKQPGHGEFYGSDSDDEPHRRKKRMKKPPVEWNSRLREKIDHFKVGRYLTMTRWYLVIVETCF